MSLDQNEEIFFMYDPSHLIKSFRNILMDHKITLQNGCKVSKKDFYDLLHVTKGELSIGYFLSEELLEVRSSDRQQVRFAIQLISDRVVALFRKFFPSCPAKLALADLIDNVAKSYKIFSSRVIFHKKDKLRSAFGVYLTEQKETLQLLIENMTHTQFGQNRFSKGFIISAKSIIALHDDLSKDSLIMQYSFDQKHP